MSDGIAWTGEKTWRNTSDGFVGVEVGVSIPLNNWLTRWRMTEPDAANAFWDSASAYINSLMERVANVQGNACEYVVYENTIRPVCFAWSRTRSSFRLIVMNVDDLPRSRKWFAGREPKAIQIHEGEIV